MWLSLPSTDSYSLTRPRIAVAIISAAAAASLGYYIYQSTHVPGPGLHRSNAIRRHARRARGASLASDTPQPQPPDEDARDDQPPQDNNPAVEEWWEEAESMPPPARAGYNLVSLLFRVSEDNARRNACVHRGCGCNSCNMIPIRGIRYRCANCADFDLCENCEAQGVHNKSHIFYKIKVPAPPFGPRQTQPVWYSGDPDTCVRVLPRVLIVNLSKESGFERPEIEAFWEQFSYMANTEWRDDPDGLQLAMDKKTFERCLVPLGRSRHATPNLIHDRMFAFYDTNHDDLIGFSEFLHGLAYRKRKDKLRRIFQGYDMDGDGYVNRRDFLRIFRAYYVLYKHMHRDILDGLDDQLMASTESQQLISSRQPLSSLFGREGRVPRADGPPRTHGKVFHPSGDVDLEDDKVPVVTEDRGDTSTRDDVLTRLFAPSLSSPSAVTPGTSAAIWSGHVRSPDSEPDTSYWDALLDPPGALDDLPSLLAGTRSQANGLDLDLEAESTSAEEDDADADADAASTDHSDDDDAAANEPAAQVIRHRRQMAPRVDRRRRAAARQALHERWRRRHFYLDEEEGGTAPDGWDESEDVLASLPGVPDRSSSAPHAKAPQHHHHPPFFPRSRSSSKVRFAEDMDDNMDVRSNPSTSSRSVPERWGGFEIPEEERDAGKEILYQITQQAFNELLDVVFREKEDLAVRAAETKEQRELHREVLDNFDIDLHLENAEEEEEEEEEEKDATAEKKEEEGYRDPTMPQFRPNNDSDLTRTPPAAKPAPGKTFSAEPQVADDGEEEQEQEQEPPAKSKTAVSVSVRVLAEWKRLDQAEKEAEERGGWGKLSYEEFEAIYRRHENPKPAGNRLDYLGSWVDFCIP
ncbi:EF-hand [Sodiomyces alkalinus F11]|uniref:EF-hand n=1 Tax=Sodiomyces alkalinus (strain CBS 110278 / VKM F-3762 / F11) TaxID=1314773 RepID=A0A3N2PKH9_SODAK|nr:EF-hand [Sodiomyces alkalinus F11]ROT35031.1 EF-hand [Sodiomyces alkalinus F11]